MKRFDAFPSPSLSLCVLADGFLAVVVQGTLVRVGYAQGRAAVLPCTIRLLMSLQCDEYSTHSRCRANMVHTRESRPDTGLGFQVQVLEPLQSFPFSLGSEAYLSLCWQMVSSLSSFKGPSAEWDTHKAALPCPLKSRTCSSD